MDKSDILRQFRWYLVEQDAPNALFRFMEAVEDFDDFLIFYVVVEYTVRVVRILHGKRDLDRILKKESADDDKLQ